MRTTFYFSITEAGNFEVVERKLYENEFIW